MKTLALLFLLKMAAALPNYAVTVPGTSTGYTRCKPVEEIKYVDQCQDYMDRVCYTTYEEHCEDVMGQTCRGLVSTSQMRQCFNVTEMICSLKEEVKYDVVEAVYTVQKCNKVSGKARGRRAVADV